MVPVGYFAGSDTGVEIRLAVGACEEPVGEDFGVLLGCGLRGLWVSALRRAGKSGDSGVGVRRAPMVPWPERGVSREPGARAQEPGPTGRRLFRVFGGAAESRRGSEWQQHTRRPAGARAVSAEVGGVRLPAPEARPLA